MSESLAKSERMTGLTLSMVSDMTGYTLPDIALVARTVAVGAPLQELAVFLHACRQLQLDPLLRQAFWIRRKQSDNSVRGTLQVGIDGFRAVAERSGAYAGAEPIEYRGQLEWTYKGKVAIVPEVARATVWKVVAGHKSAFVGEAAWVEFVPNNEREQFQWARMPRHMLGKCAEAQALRRAFPAQLGSLEMGEAFNPDELPTMAVTPSETAPQARQSRSQKELADRYTQIYEGAQDLPEAPVDEDEDAVEESSDD